jgi:hypothetical protein
MSSSCSILHLRGAGRASVLQALDGVLRDAGFLVRREGPLPGAGGSFDEISRQHPLYLAAPDGQPWATLIEASADVPRAPWFPEVAESLSRALRCTALCLVVHDDEEFFYNLLHEGQVKDGYNSCPQYFESERLSEDEIEAQRHTPDALAPILPPGVSVEAVRKLLDRGWWNAHDSGRLDEHGLAPDSFDGEGQRMTEFAQLLGLYQGSYPYAEWRENPAIEWSGFESVVYARDR